MPFTTPSYYTAFASPGVDFLPYATERLVVAPGADAREVKFLAGRTLYSAQTDDLLVLAPAEETPAQSTVVLDQWALETAFRERDAVLAQLPALAEYYQHISREHIERATALVVYRLGVQLKPQALASHLLYSPSLHVRADLPNGAVHLSVIFEPGIDPLNPTPDEDGDDANAIASFYDAHGALRAGTSGPLPQVLLQLNDLAEWPATEACV